MKGGGNHVGYAKDAHYEGECCTKLYIRNFREMFIFANRVK